MESDVVQTGLGLAPFGDVLHLQDQARRGRFDLGEEAAVHVSPDVVAVAVVQLQFDRERVDFCRVQLR